MRAPSARLTDCDPPPPLYLASKPIGSLIIFPHIFFKFFDSVFLAFEHNTTNLD